MYIFMCKLVFGGRRTFRISAILSVFERKDGADF